MSPQEHIAKLHKLQRGQVHVYYNSTWPRYAEGVNKVFHTARVLFDDAHVELYQKRNYHTGGVDYCARGRLSEQDRKRLTSAGEAVA